MKEFSTYVQASSGSIKKVGVKYDIDPNHPKQKGAALLSFRMTKRAMHPYSEQFNYFVEPSLFKMGYMIEDYPRRLSSLKLLDSTTFGIFYRYSKL